MKDFFKIARYILPYKKYAILNIVLNLISVFFSLFSFTMVIPFLQILFKTNSEVSALLPWTYHNLQHNFYYYLSFLIHHFGEMKALFLICILVVMMSLLKNFFGYMASWCMAPIINGVVRDFQHKIFNKIIKLPLSYFSDERKGDIISKMTSDVQEIKFSIMSSLDMIFRDPLTILIYVAFLVFMSPALTIFVLILLPISALVIGALGKSLKSKSLIGQNKLGELISIVEETLSGLRIIKAFNGEKKMMEKFNKLNYTFYRIINRITRRRSLSSPMSEFLGMIVTVVILYFGSSMVLGKTSNLTPESFMSYLLVFASVITPAKSLSSAYYNIQKGLASAQRIDVIIDAEETIQDKKDAIPVKEFKSFLEFRDVSFSYVSEPVLKNINLRIEKGKTVALVGRSGSGKSTMVDLIPRFIEANQGEVLIDGIPVQDFKIEDLRNLMGIVSQEAILFNDSFFNNIAFGIENATKEDVIIAAKIANAHSFIMETPDGYDTNVGDRGGKLSGGQRQRISIARAVLKNPPILILDEATSSLDTESERLVQEAIFNLMKNRTSIVIAHRLSTIKHADEICVLDEGKIVERGKHEELLENKGIYKKLHKLQMY